MLAYKAELGIRRAFDECANTQLGALALGVAGGVIKTHEQHGGDTQLGMLCFVASLIGAPALAAVSSHMAHKRSKKLVNSVVPETTATTARDVNPVNPEDPEDPEVVPPPTIRIVKSTYPIPESLAAGAANPLPYAAYALAPLAGMFAHAVAYTPEPGGKATGVVLAGLTAIGALLGLNKNLREGRSSARKYAYIAEKRGE